MPADIHRLFHRMFALFGLASKFFRVIGRRQLLAVLAAPQVLFSYFSASNSRKKLNSFACVLTCDSMKATCNEVYAGSGVKRAFFNS